MQEKTSGEMPEKSLEGKEETSIPEKAIAEAIRLPKNLEKSISEREQELSDLRRQWDEWPKDISKDLERIVAVKKTEYGRNPKEFIERVNKEREGKFTGLKDVFESGDEKKIAAALDDVDALLLRQYGNLISPQDLSRVHEFLEQLGRGKFSLRSNDTEPEPAVSLPTLLRAGNLYLVDIEGKGEYSGKGGVYISLWQDVGKKERELSCLGCASHELLTMKGEPADKLENFNSALEKLNLFKNKTLDIEKWKYKTLPKKLNW
jgi:hypothetical protein